MIVVVIENSAYFPPPTTLTPKETMLIPLVLFMYFLPQVIVLLGWFFTFLFTKRIKYQRFAKPIFYGFLFSITTPLFYINLFWRENLFQRFVLTILGIPIQTYMLYILDKKRNKVLTYILPVLNFIIIYILLTLLNEIILTPLYESIF